MKQEGAAPPGAIAAQDRLNVAGLPAIGLFDSKGNERGRIDRYLDDCALIARLGEIE